jgi:hypothetical protein
VKIIIGQKRSFATILVFRTKSKRVVETKGIELIQVICGKF